MNLHMYLHRHWPSHIELSELEKLPTPRLLAYYRKHLGKKESFKNGYPSHLVKKNDLSYNSEFGTSPNSQFQAYFNGIKAILDKRENISY
jgi:hypothetical protein